MVKWKEQTLSNPAGGYEVVIHSLAIIMSDKYSFA